MEIKLHLFRNLNDQDLRWSHVGPDHERLTFNLIDIVGYMPEKNNDQPPYRIYNPFGWRGAAMPANSHASRDEAKQACREYALAWIERAGDGPVVWEALESGVHWRATADGVDMASYYYCPKTRGRWHKDFRVWFGGTYFLIDFASPEDARSEVERTWRIWLSIAKSGLFSHNQTVLHG